MEVLLVRAAVPFPCPRRSQKSGEVTEPKSRTQKLLTTSDRSTEPATKSSTVASASNNRSVDPQTSPFGTLVPLPAFPLKFSWFKAGNKKEVEVAAVAAAAAAAAAACDDVASLALSSAHDDVTTLALTDAENRTVHEVLTTLQSSELTALEVASIKPLGSDVDTRASDATITMAPEDLAKAEAEIAKSWLHNFMRFKPLWNIRQINATTKAPRKQTAANNSSKSPGGAVLEADCAEKAVVEDGDCDSRDSTAEEGDSNLMDCVCEECSSGSVQVNTDGREEETKEITHVKIVHTRESFSKFLRSVPVAELRTVSHLSFLSNLAYSIPSIKPGDLLRHHGLRFITSSVHIKAAEEKSAMEKAIREKAAQDEAAGKDNARITEPEEEAKPVTSEASNTKEDDNADKGLISRFSFMKKKVKTTEPTAYQLGSSPCKVLLADDSDEVCMECKSKLEEAVEVAPSAPLPTAAGVEDTKQSEVQPVRSCPCAWFICDDDPSNIRNFVIQGSDSVASWQANLLFEPTRFEDPKLGVMVHRGIYEAAKVLYDEVLPHVLEHIQKHGSAAKIRFTGHSLGGSLAILLSLLLRVRDTAPSSSLLPVYTFGSPYVLCGGDYLLQQLGLPQNHVRMVVMHRDIVPRSFTCDYPDHVAEVLKRVNGTFRDYSCLKKQRLLYAPMGVMRVIQPAPTQAPGHPLLPGGSGIYDLMHPSSSSSTKQETQDSAQQSIELRSAHRAFLNNPHPLEILRDRASYGTGGGISRDHDPRSYCKAVSYVLRQEQRKVRRTEAAQTKRRGSVWWPAHATESSVEFIKGVVLKASADSEQSVNTGECGSIGAASSGMGATHQVLRRSGSLVADGGRISSPRNTITSGSTMDRLSRYSRLIASKHVHIGMLLLVSARVLLMQGLATFIG